MSCNLSRRALLAGTTAAATAAAVPAPAASAIPQPARLDRIDWRELQNRVIETCRPLYDSDGDSWWDSAYMRRIYAAIRPLIPPATLDAYADANWELVEFFNAESIGSDDLIGQANEALRHVLESEIFTGPALTLADAVTRLRFLGQMDDRGSFSDGVFTAAEIMAIAVRDFERLAVVRNGTA